MDSRRTLFFATAAFLVIALLLGGKQSPHPLFHAIIELTGVALAANIFWTPASIERSPQYRYSRAFIAALALLPILQLLPLPPVIWTSLPGRELVAATDRTLGFVGIWRPFSLSPEGTLRAALAVIPPAAMFFAVARLNETERRKLILLVIIVGILGLCVSLVQFGSPPGSFRLYRGVHDTVPVGLFANRNHHALFMALCLLLLSGWLRGQPNLRPSMANLIWGTGVASFAAGAIVTNSRMGFALLLVALIGGIYIMYGDRIRLVSRSHRSIQSAGLAAAWLLGAAAIGGAILTSSTTIKTLDRFQNTTELRFSLWPDVNYAIAKYAPAGAGLGAFDPVFRSIENLNTLGDKYFNHAHNDYLEILLETGIFGLVLIGSFFALLAYIFRKRAKPTPPIFWAGFLSILLCLLHSIVDYPLRTYSLSVVFALCGALLFPPIMRTHKNLHSYKDNRSPTESRS